MHFDLPKPLTSIQWYLDAGFYGGKIKIGAPDLAEDIARVRAVRELVVPDATFMVDANDSMNVAQAIAPCGALKPYDITWFEEPVIPEDQARFGQISEAADMHVFHGNMAARVGFSRVIGHEMSGVVEAVADIARLFGGGVCFFVQRRQAFEAVKAKRG
ncbi:MAG: enolase C-terminal domain-like protein [Pseudomonadota bacterium]